MGAGSLKGDVLCLGSAACWAVYSVAVSRLPRTLSASTALTFTFAAGSLLVLIYCGPAMARQDYSRVGALSWTILALSALLPLVLAFRAWDLAIRGLGVSQATSLTFLTPVVAGVASAVWTGERFSASQVLAAAAVLAGLAVTRLSRRPAV